MNASGYAFLNSVGGEALSPSIGVARYGFKINGLSFIYRADISSEVIKDVRVCAIPTTQKWFNGMINVRGHLIPVFDLNRLFFNEKTDSGLFLVLDKGSKAVAFRIKKFPELIENIVQTDRHDKRFNDQLIPDFIRDYIVNYYASGSQPWLEFDKNAFLSSLTQRISIYS
ncbi:MAG: chemotaxis protein CheW [Methylobacter sp.]|nr:chemotaxis protein CheW [Methylobacter sp.]